MKIEPPNGAFRRRLQLIYTFTGFRKPGTPCMSTQIRSYITLARCMAPVAGICQLWTKELEFSRVSAPSHVYKARQAIRTDGQAALATIQQS